MVGMAEGRVIVEGIDVTVETFTTVLGIDSEGDDPSSCEPSSLSSFSRSSSCTWSGCWPSC